MSSSSWLPGFVGRLCLLTFLVMVGLNSWKDLHNCRRVCQVWCVMISKMTKLKKIIMRGKVEILAAQIRGHCEREPPPPASPPSHCCHCGHPGSLRTAGKGTEAEGCQLCNVWCVAAWGISRARPKCWCGVEEWYCLVLKVFTWSWSVNESDLVSGLHPSVLRGNSNISHQYK